MGIKMWGEAVRTIPRVSNEDWKTLDFVSKWLIATRAAVLLMTAISVMVGALLAAYLGHFNWVKFALCFFGLLLSHATNNLINDFVDSARGVDSNNAFRTKYGPQPVQSGLWSRQTALVVIGITGLVALACGIALVAMQGIGVLYLLILGAFFVVFYTWPLKVFGLGEPAVLLVWGPLIVGGTFYVITGHWSFKVAAIGLLYALGPTMVLFGKHIDKSVEDRKKRVYSLPVLLGESLARKTVITMLIVQPIALVIFVIFNLLPWPVLITLLSLGVTYQTIRIFSVSRPTERPEQFPEQFWPTYLASFAFRANRATGSLFILGLVISLILESAHVLHGL